MRVRALSPTGDMTFGSSQSNYIINTPQAVAQVAETRLGLFQGEWYLDKTVGTPPLEGARANLTADAAIQTTVRGTPGMVDIFNYISVYNNRQLSVSMRLKTIYDNSSSPLAQLSVTL